MTAPPARFPSSRPGHPSTPWFGFRRAARAPRGVAAEPGRLARVAAPRRQRLSRLRLGLGTGRAAGEEFFGLKNSCVREGARSRPSTGINP